MDVCFIEYDTIETFKRVHPFGRIYELPSEPGDIYNETKEFEIMEWNVRMLCVGKKDGVSKWRRIKKMSFE